MSKLAVLNALEANIATLERELANCRSALAIMSEGAEGFDELTLSDNVVSLAKHKSKVAPKWRHKKDKTLTWSGRGRQPKWISGFGVKVKSA